MTCAQGLLRLLWGGPKLECYVGIKKAGIFFCFYSILDEPFKNLSEIQ